MSLGESTTTGSELRRLGFDDLIERLRSTVPNSWEPWISERHYGDGSPVQPSPAIDALVQVLHFGREIDSARLSAPLLREASDSDLLVQTNDNRIGPRRWRLSSFKGIIAAADSEYGEGTADVHLGEDSLRFADFILKIAPQGHVLDVGSGSGISSVACAKSSLSVNALDILESACEATRITAELNSMKDRISVETGDFRFDDIFAGPYDSVVANLPGVPVPNGITYPTAGNGGEDGLNLIRQFWSLFSEYGGPASLVMRFQSLGSATAGPIALRELERLLGATHRIYVTADSAAPVELRDSITARRASLLMNRPIGELRLEFDRSRIAAGCDTFYCCSLLAVGSDAPGLSYVNNLPQLKYSAIPAIPNPNISTLRLRFARSLNLLPDEYWSLEEPQWEELIFDVFEQTVEVLLQGLPIADAATEVAELMNLSSAANSPRIGLEILVGLLASCMRAHR